MMALREACISFVWWMPARGASVGWTKTGPKLTADRLVNAGSPSHSPKASDRWAPLDIWITACPSGQTARPRALRGGRGAYAEPTRGAGKPAFRQGLGEGRPEP